jgi:hypothetical protein
VLEQCQAGTSTDKAPSGSNRHSRWVAATTLLCLHTGSSRPCRAQQAQSSICNILSSSPRRPCCPAATPALLQYGHIQPRMPLLQVCQHGLVGWVLQRLPHLVPAAVVYYALPQLAQAQPLTDCHVAGQRLQLCSMRATRAGSSHTASAQVQTDRPTIIYDAGVCAGVTRHAMLLSVWLYHRAPTVCFRHTSLMHTLPA